MSESTILYKGSYPLSSYLLLWDLAIWSVKLVAVAVCLKLYFRYTSGKCTDDKDMTGKTVIITGANTGLGKATAEELASRNARVIIACRNPDKAKAAVQDIFAKTGKQVIFRQLDLSSFESIRKFAEVIKAEEDKVDVLINNAGVLPPKETEFTKDGIDIGIQSNYLGSFLLTNLLLESLKKSGNGRIINLSSILHALGRPSICKLIYKRYPHPLFAYGDTKLANVLFTLELSRRLEGTGITVNACHPGFVKTEIASKNWLLWLSFQVFLFFIGKDVHEGSQTTVHLAVADEVSRVTGKYFVDCKEAWSFPTAWNRKTALILWHNSEKMTGLASS